METVHLMDGRQIALTAARVLEEKKVGPISIYDLREATDIADYFVIATVDNRPQMRAAIKALQRELKSLGEETVRVEGDAESQWQLVDCIDCVVHLFSPDLREYYNLEMLWGDHEVTDWRSELKIRA